MTNAISDKWLGRGQMTNSVLVVYAIGLALAADGNGRILSFGERLSSIMAISCFLAGILLSVFLLLLHKGHRLGPAVCLMIYVILGAPAFFK